MTDAAASTIAAISTPAGVGGIAVVRLSGPDALRIADSVWHGRRLSEVASHTAHLGEIIDSDGSMLDQAVATVFAAGRSFTGEATVEFSVHGSKWIQNRVVSRLIEAGASPAKAGEFTLRAVRNGRIDLAQAEGIADMIAASSKAAQRLAATQMKGTFSRHLDSLRQQMVDMASLLELELDFSEEDVEFADRSHLASLCDTAIAQIDSLAATFKAGKALKEGVATVIAGRPNAGKSTLLNLLLGDDKAIVSDIPGTTRDVIEDTAEINGILFRFIDTAGLRDTSDSIEQIGVDRARRQISAADILLWVIDPTDPEGVTPQLVEFADTLRSLPHLPHSLLLFNKSDLGAAASSESESAKTASSDGENLSIAVPESAQTKLPKGESLSIDLSAIPRISISAADGSGIDRLTAQLTTLAEEGCDPGADIIVTNLRHYEALRLTSDALHRVADLLPTDLPSDLIAQDLREATHYLGTITGAITPADLLQTIFSRFCIGK
ncbi:MAG: tRNA uridine-5-carboxymethylaminomethyl(34) synthesis GTPase MnmE [Muribaculaceae bacterium]|nr:tRNA uridine-5-carboxymethylaminomethyl(34) synthesis GTPase MnmE [Muribaculaceae bacterium]